MLEGVEGVGIRPGLQGCSVYFYFEVRAVYQASLY
jgi:hypothetical protein